MRCTEVMYEYKFNTGNYESETIRLTVALEQGESATTVIAAAKKIVHGTAPKVERMVPQKVVKANDVAY